MLVTRCAQQSRQSLYPIPLYFINFISTAATVHGGDQKQRRKLPESEILAPFKQWFMSRKNPPVDGIFDILRRQDDVDADLCRLNLNLTESIVLEVLRRGDPKRDWHCCMKFFDWAERINRFQHTPATCLTIFRILHRANQLEELVQFLNWIWERRYFQQVQFHSVMVSGYAMAGGIDFALTLFGRMRFLGLDLDSVSYHVLLNALVEHEKFHEVETVADQIRRRGFENGITRSILVKNFCKQKEFDKAEEFLWRLLSQEGGDASSNGIIVGTVVDALCKVQQSERAHRLMKEVEELGTVPMERAKNMWMKNLIEASDVDKALDFLKASKQGDFVPDVFRYNSLLKRLSSDFRFEEVYDLLEEMKEVGVVPNSATMNYALFFFCKTWMMDAALEMFNLRADFGFSVNAASQNYLLNMALKHANVDNAYSLLGNVIEQGILPCRKVFTDIARKEGELDKMFVFVSAMFEKDFAMGQTAYHRFLLGLFKSQRWVDGYRFNEKFNASGRVTCKSSYSRLISGLIKAGEESRAVELFIEMQENGHEPDRKLYRVVIGVLCNMDNPVAEFSKLLHRFPPTVSRTYNKFIYGAGKERQYILARKVYDVMKREGILPDLESDVLVLQSFMKNEKTSEALHFFDDLSMERKVKKKLLNSMFISLCKVKGDYAIAMERFWRLRNDQFKLSIECYEALLKLLFASRHYKLIRETYMDAIKIVDDLYSTGRRLSSFIGNTLLVHAWKSHVNFEYWLEHQEELSLRAESWELIELMNDFSEPSLLHNFVSMEAHIGRCFSLDSFTYNLLFQRLMDIDSDQCFSYFNRLKKRGIEPNCLSYGLYARHLAGWGLTADAKKVIEVMEKKGCKNFEGTKAYME